MDIKQLVKIADSFQEDDQYIKFKEIIKSNEAFYIDPLDLRFNDETFELPKSEEDFEKIWQWVSEQIPEEGDQVFLDFYENSEDGANFTDETIWFHRKGGRVYCE